MQYSSPRRGKPNETMKFNFSYMIKFRSVKISSFWSGAQWAYEDVSLLSLEAHMRKIAWHSNHSFLRSSVWGKGATDILVSLGNKLALPISCMFFCLCHLFSSSSYASFVGSGYFYLLGIGKREWECMIRGLNIGSLTSSILWSCYFC